MAGRGRTTYNKRLKEQKRLEKRQMKEARRDARKAAKTGSPAGPEFGSFEPLEQAPGEAAESDAGESHPSAPDHQ